MHVSSASGLKFKRVVKFFQLVLLLLSRFLAKSVTIVLLFWTPVFFPSVVVKFFTVTFILIILMIISFL